MARDINNKANGVDADDLTQIGTVTGATHIGSGGRVTSTEIHGDGTTVINGDEVHTNISHTFNK
ncbi:hypothetical protein ACH4GK_31880 [Streptomyces rimosus]|uniref:hypothetical protein n=1 Tax=Streptomyces rimosus TaxID=1927 RepID=UPI0004C66B31|nr:hypothetical protein [Streptomyces rimosus]